MVPGRARVRAWGWRSRTPQVAQTLADPTSAHQSDPSSVNVDSVKGLSVRDDTATSARRLPLLSVVIPSYNQAQYIETALASVIGQGDPNLRIAVVDGGSTDGSVDVIRKYASHLDYWCSEPDGGQTAAINKGFAKIGGDIRGWLNSDDAYVPGAFAAVRRAFAADPTLGLVYGNRILIGPADEVYGWTKFAPFDPWTSGYTIASETAFWTAAAQGKVGQLDESLRFAMDLDFFSRLFLAVPSLQIKEYVGRFRCHDESKSATLQEVCAQETELLWHRHFGDIDTWKREPKLRRVRHAVDGLTHPRTLTVPWLRHKMARGAV